MQKNKSFTLIELLVVIAVIGLLSSVVLVNVQGTRGKARIAKSLSFSHTIQNTLGANAVGIWRLEEGSGSTVYDSSGYSNNGTISGGATFTTGISGSALSFDGIDDYVNAGNGASLSLNDNNGFTLEIWFKSTANSAGFVTKQTMGSGMQNADWQFGFKIWDSGGTNGHVAFMTFSNGTTYGSIDYLESTTAMNDNQWHHAVVVGNSVNRYLYIDGVLNTSKSKVYSIYYNSNTFVWLGYSSSSGQKYYNGTIDEVRIYNQALSAFEIQKHYAEGIERHQYAKK